MIETNEQLDTLLDMRQERFQAEVAEALKRVLTFKVIVWCVALGATLVTTLGLGAWDYWNTSRTQRQHIIVMRGQILALQEAQGLREEIEETQEMLKLLLKNEGILPEEE